jgi:hypothetical protein
MPIFRPLLGRFRSFRFKGAMLKQRTFAPGLIGPGPNHQSVLALPARRIGSADGVPDSRSRYWLLQC